MNYILKKEGAEDILCTKVTIDGFDYYVSKDIPKNKDWVIDVMITKNELRKHEVDEEFGVFTQGKVYKVIATNNPNIDLPQVIDEVEKIAMDYAASIYDGRERNQIAKFNGAKIDFIKGYNKSQETHSFSEDDMIEFAQIYLSKRFDNPRMSNKDIFNL